MEFQKLLMKLVDFNQKVSIQIFTEAFKILASIIQVTFSHPTSILNPYLKDLKI